MVVRLDSIRSRLKHLEAEIELLLVPEMDVLPRQAVAIVMAGMGLVVVALMPVRRTRRRRWPQG